MYICIYVYIYIYIDIHTGSRGWDPDRREGGSARAPLDGGGHPPRALESQPAACFSRHLSQHRDSAAYTNSVTLLHKFCNIIAQML